MRWRQNHSLSGFNTSDRIVFSNLRFKITICITIIKKVKSWGFPIDRIGDKRNMLPLILYLKEPFREVILIVNSYAMCSMFTILHDSVVIQDTYGIKLFFFPKQYTILLKHILNDVYMENSTNIYELILVFKFSNITMVLDKCTVQWSHWQLYPISQMDNIVGRLTIPIMTFS